jgi:hypothetical protein
MPALSPFSRLLLSALVTACAPDNRHEAPGAALPVVTRKPTAKPYLSQDSLHHYVAASTPIRPNKKARAPFQDFSYDRVIAYAYDGGDGETITALVQHGQLAPTIRQQQRLSQQQVNEVTDLLGAPATYGQAPAFCFLPQVGLVFFRGTQVKAFISVSLPCNRLSASPTIPATQAQQIQIRKGATYPAEGFSQAGRAKLTALLQALGLSAAPK